MNFRDSKTIVKDFAADISGDELQRQILVAVKKAKTWDELGDVVCRFPVLKNQFVKTRHQWELCTARRGAGAGFAGYRTTTSGWGALWHDPDTDPQLLLREKDWHDPDDPIVSAELTTELTFGKWRKKTVKVVEL